MPDDATATDDQAASSSSGNVPIVIVPPQLQKDQPELVEFIMKSESMNNEERQYWIDILPVMTPDQVTQLRSILENERTQLAAIDAKYAKEIESGPESAAIRQTDEVRLQRRTERTKEEESVKTTEEEAMEDILKKMD